jgi:hypothetical protein
MFEGLPSLPSILATDQQWSTDAQFYQGPALDDTHFLPTGDQEESAGSIPYVTLPKTGHSAQASVRLRFDRLAVAYLDPVAELTRLDEQNDSEFFRTLKKTDTTSLMGTCDSFGIVGDPRGHEKLAAFGRVSKVVSLGDEEGDEWWTPDWAIVSGVLPKGTVRRVLDECRRGYISADGKVVE